MPSSRGEKSRLLGKVNRRSRAGEKPLSPLQRVHDKAEVLSDRCRSGHPSAGCLIQDKESWRIWA